MDAQPNAEPDSGSKQAATVRLLSYGGLIPFVGGGALAWATDGAWRAFALQAVIVYAVAILSFIGAIHWGRVLAGREEERSGSAWLVWGVAPSLLGWFAVLLPQALTLMVLVLSFGLAWAADRLAVAEGRYPGWFGRLRTVLTTVVCLTLAALIPLVR
ncbi:DUF3429 domain-containing protein [Azospirillum rugosum]|uniref:DUF3429 domain-containing protein n=1 Tax=Azospirillum rugosum TaxID=416170 RepID=A0ABS4SPS4_9PROT|nr:DUF3429 domain-containing protein [Azospirillum rugosum]MBP2294556.1 hypothetical protein [Azospirillum rugosum]MDQ0524656.1 hypothetical protein [Azospirillum rugosum]